MISGPFTWPSPEELRLIQRIEDLFARSPELGIALSKRVLPGYAEFLKRDLRREYERT